MGITRKTFVAGSLAVGAIAVLDGCGGDGNGTVTVMSDDTHPHTWVITCV